MLILLIRADFPDLRDGTVPLSASFLGRKMANRDFCFIGFIACCEDKNECTTASHNCVGNQTGGNCTNTDGSYMCSCLRGYIGNGIRQGKTVGKKVTGSGCGKYAELNAPIFSQSGRDYIL